MINCLFLIIFLCSFSLVGCVRWVSDPLNKPYQKQIDVINISNKEQKIQGKQTYMGFGVIEGKTKNFNETNFFKSEIEYSSICDKENICGRKFENKQKKRILDAIENYEDPLLVVLYIHGWHHNASNESRNYEYFPNMLSRFDDQLERKKILDPNFEKPEVFGIYIGWPGKVENNFDTFSLGNRGCVADQISFGYKEACNSKIKKSNSEMKKDIVDIINMVKRKNENSKMLIIGHSFGGRIVSNMFVEDLELALDNNQSNILGDNILISTVNPAIGYKKFQNIKRTAIKKSIKPTWINFTSMNDDPTKFGFPFGRLTVLKDSGFLTIGHKNSYQTHEFNLEHYGRWECNSKYLDGKFKKCQSESNTLGDKIDIESEISWFKPEQGNEIKGYIPYFERKGNKFGLNALKGCKTDREGEKNCLDLDLYGAKLVVKNPYNSLFYNIYTDYKLIGFDDNHRKKYNKNSDHNGFISTNLVHLYINRLYSH